MGAVEGLGFLIVQRRIRKRVIAFHADEEQSHTRLLSFRLVLKENATGNSNPVSDRL
jgi:hypothetical protein